MTKRQVMGTTIGPMDVNMKDIGIKVSNMGLVFSKIPRKRKLSMAFGSTESELHGLMKVWYPKSINVNTITWRSSPTRTVSNVVSPMPHSKCQRDSMSKFKI